MQTIINVIVFILVLGTIIFIHELGHFVAAKTFKVFCAEFSLGMGPKIFSKKVGETEYQLRALPIGGFVSMAGEADQEDNELMKDIPHERTLKGISTWKKCVVMLAGVFMNFLLAIVLLIGVYSFVNVQTDLATVGAVSQDGGAQAAGIIEGDQIQQIIIEDNEFTIKSFSDVQTVLSNPELFSNSQAETIDIEIQVLRDNKVLMKDVKATYNKNTKSYMIGITPETRRLSFVEAIKYGTEQFTTMSLLIFTTLGKLITDSGNTLGQLSGPAGIYNVTAEITASGSISNLLLLTAMLSTNIGMFNLLPIPGLDGSQVLFAVVEKIIRREIPTKLKYGLQLAGLALVFGLMIFVTINDISKIFG